MERRRCVYIVKTEIADLRGRDTVLADMYDVLRYPIRPACAGPMRTVRNPNDITGSFNPVVTVFSKRASKERATAARP